MRVKVEEQIRYNHCLFNYGRMSMFTLRNTSFLFFILVVSLSIYRAVMLYTINPDLYVDEAYYWVWSQQFDWGYYSKPPMVAWIISIATSLFGDGSLIIKSISIFIYPLTATFIYLTAKALLNEKTAFYAGLLFFTSPAVSLSSLIISTDVVLLFFWSLTLYFFVMAMKFDRTIFWVLTGLFGGLGLLSKYNMILFVVSAFIYLAVSRVHRNILTKTHFYLTLLIALLVFLPNLLWNYHNHFISFVHLHEISQVEKTLFHFNKLLEFLGAQFGVFGPVSFGVLLYIFIKSYTHRKDNNFMLFFWFSVIFLGVISTQAFLARAFANWAAPTYVAASILVAYFLVSKQRTTLLKWAIAVNILLMMTLYHYESILHTAGIELSKRNDPYKRIRGWKALGNKISTLYQNYPNHILLADGRKEISELIYYVKPHPWNTQIFNPKGAMQNYYHQTQNLNDHIGENFIYLTAERSIADVSHYFETTQYLQPVTVPIHKDYNLSYHLFELKHFKGYGDRP